MLRGHLDRKKNVASTEGNVTIWDSKNMGGLRIMPRYGIKNKKNRFGYKSVPLKYTYVDFVTIEPLSQFMDLSKAFDKKSRL